MQHELSDIKKGLETEAHRVELLWKSMKDTADNSKRQAVFNLWHDMIEAKVSLLRIERMDRPW